jgi:hypothetical protein
MAQDALGASAKMVDCVGSSDAFVPTSDKGLVHFCNARERSPARADNVFVPEMGVGYEEHRHSKSPRKTPPRLTGKPSGRNARKNSRELSRNLITPFGSQNCSRTGPGLQPLVFCIVVAHGPSRMNSPAALVFCVRIAGDLTKMRLIARLRVDKSLIFRDKTTKEATPSTAAPPLQEARSWLTRAAETYLTDFIASK